MKNMTMTKLAEELQEILLSYESESKALLQATQGRAGEVFREATLAFFEQNPDIASFGWKQFEPWRDGEETEFEVFKSEDEILINGFSVEDMENASKSDSQIEKHKQLAVKASNFLDGLNDKMLETVFGHGAIITVSRKGIEIEEYEDG